MRSCASRCAPTSRFLHQRVRTTTLYVTHDQTEAMTMGDRVAVMRDGRSSSATCRSGSTTAPEPLRRRLHRLPGDEPRPLPARPGGGVLSVELCGDADLADAVGAGAASATPRVSRPLGDRRHPAGGLGGRSASSRARTARASTSTCARRADGRGGDRPLPARRPSRSEAAATPLELASHETAATTLTARLSPRSSARAGGRIRLAVDVDRLHFFDGETEQALS